MGFTCYRCGTNIITCCLPIGKSYTCFYFSSCAFREITMTFIHFIAVWGRIWSYAFGISSDFSPEFRIPGHWSSRRTMRYLNAKKSALNAADEKQSRTDLFPEVFGRDREQINGLNKRIANLIINNDCLKNERNQARYALKNCKDKLTDCKDKLTDCEDELTDCKDKLEGVYKRRGETLTAWTKAKEEVVKIQEQINDLIKERDTLKRAVKDKGTHLDDAKNERDEALRDLASLKKICFSLIGKFTPTPSDVTKGTT